MSTVSRFSVVVFRPFPTRACRVCSRLTATVRGFGRTVRPSEYHITSACNLRCQGCWFFTYECDKQTKGQTDLSPLKAFIERERGRHVNTALLIGGQPANPLSSRTVWRHSSSAWTVLTNGLRPLPRAGFELVSIGVTLFGGGPLDDGLRAIRPDGRAFTGLFDRGLSNYRDDPRVIFNYAITDRGVDQIEPTVRRIRDNGNRVTLNFYSEHHTDTLLRSSDSQRLLEAALRVQEIYGDTVVAHPYYVRALVTGRTDFGHFGYDVCPSVSWNHPDHAARRANRNPTLPLFNVYGADLETVQFCCTSGHCGGCRDSQAIQTWLLVSVRRFLNCHEGLATWVELAESYWRQFI